jgi:hypothetical protein
MWCGESNFRTWGAWGAWGLLFFIFIIINVLKTVHRNILPPINPAPFLFTTKVVVNLLWMGRENMG